MAMTTERQAQGDRVRSSSRNILVILGHPDKDSFCSALAAAYSQSARASGAAVRELWLGELQFDPTLWHGYHHIQPLEPDLVRAQDDIVWANHLVFVYPNWWGSMPALMKGFFDRAFLPGFAFKYHKQDPFWDRLLAGRSAHLIVTMDTPAWYYRWMFKMPGHQQMKRTILEFCGIKPIKITEIAPVRGSTPAQRSRWLAKIQKLATQSIR
ncbi:MAG: NAD(P)H-dependent oxidoreductase [Leptolyngbyaceae cyanobacterium bins.349]|nr:NAD(P)H-dependent oxidoreductase [Leptolyngbyaceae cyanobacterium bins.349]